RPGEVGRRTTEVEIELDALGGDGQGQALIGLGLALGFAGDTAVRGLDLRASVESAAVSGSRSRSALARSCLISGSGGGEIRSTVQAVERVRTGSGIFRAVTRASRSTPPGPWDPG